MPKLKLFQGYGVELEYMIVDRETLKVLPVTDIILKDFHGSFIDEIENGAISWSNELALHVIELKTNGPSENLNGLADLFAGNVKEINTLLAQYNGMLLPTAMHPFMDPFSEMKLWPHERNEIYEKYNSIFNCKGHGWANLQSVHINLPFANDAEFEKLHAAIRLILPILPALAASSPIMDGVYSGFKDTRLEVYQNNQKRIPSISGKVIPEPVFSENEYKSRILERNYRDISPFDPEGILQDEWLNSRGAIARFQRNAIEIRVLDIQECPAADLAIIKLIVATIQNLVNERWSTLQDQKSWQVEPLYLILQACIKMAEDAEISDSAFLRTFGYKGEVTGASEIWKYLLQENIQSGYDFSETDLAALNNILTQGSLSSRIHKTIGPDINSHKLVNVYKKLSECLANNSLFIV